MSNCCFSGPIPTVGWCLWNCEDPIQFYGTWKCFLSFSKENKQPCAADPAVIVAVVAPASCSLYFWFAVRCVGLLSHLFLYLKDSFIFYLYFSFLKI